MHSSKIKKLKKDLLEHWKLIREVEAPVLNLKDFQMKMGLAEFVLTLEFIDFKDMKKLFQLLGTRQINKALKPPLGSSNSKLLNSLQVTNIMNTLPEVYQNYDWKLLYRLSDDGVSMNTFMKCMKGSLDTIIVFEDASGYKFGGFQCEEWHLSKDFYGSGQNYVFTFRDGNKIKMFPASSENLMYQFSN